MPQRKSRAPQSPTAGRIRALQRTARDAVAAVGATVRRRHRVAGQAATRKAPGDFVTAVDLTAETALRRRILAAWPDHGVIGEELPSVRPGAEFVWILDPIDGTSNFSRGLPVFAVSAACLWRGRPVAAAVHCLPEDETYSAGQGAGARRRGRRLVLDGGRSLDDGSILGVQWHRVPRDLSYLEPLVATGSRIRVFGSTVTQLCDVATGRLDGNVQEQGRIWDFAAAALLVTESGGRFTSWTGEDIFPLPDLDGDRHYPSVAAAPGVHRQLCGVLGGFADRIGPLDGPGAPPPPR